MAKNYIIKLQDENKIYRDGIRRLRKYLHSDKFSWPENSVNVDDIFLRLGEIDTEILDAEFDNQ